MKPSEIKYYNQCEFLFSYQGLNYILPVDDLRQTKIEMNNNSSEYKSFKDCYTNLAGHYTETIYVDVDNVDIGDLEGLEEYILNHKDEWILDEPEFHFHRVSYNHFLINFYEGEN